MIKRSYFFKVEVKPALQEKYLNTNDYIIITGTFNMMTFFSQSEKLYNTLLDSIQDSIPFDIEPKDWLITAFNRID